MISKSKFFNIAALELSLLGIILPSFQAISYIHTKNQINKAEQFGKNYAESYCKSILENSTVLDKLLFAFDEAAIDHLYNSKP